MGTVLLDIRCRSTDTSPARTRRSRSRSGRAARSCTSRRDGRRADGQADVQRRPFVTDGPEAALAQARAAAGERSVLVAGGAGLAQQYLWLRALDELQVHVVPLLLGRGTRLFDGPGDWPRLERTRVIDSPRVTHLHYRVVR